MNNTGLLVSRAVADSDGAALLDTAKAAGFDAELVISDPARRPTPTQLDSIRFALLSVDVIGNSTSHRTDASFDAMVATMLEAPNAAWLQTPSAGMDRPIYRQLLDQGLRLSSASGANAKAVAHSAVTGLLALSRRVPMWIREQDAHRWSPMRGELIPPAIEGQRAVVVGMGAIGLEIAKLLSAFDLKVTGVRRQVSPAPGFERVICLETLDEVLPSIDWLILACPLTEQTRGLVDARRLGLFRRGAGIVNIARGAVVDEAALIESLASGQLGAAYLDVFTTEPLPATSPLWDMPNVLLSAHTAGNSSSHQRNVVELFKINLARIATAVPLVNEWLG